MKSTIFSRSLLITSLILLFCGAGTADDVIGWPGWLGRNRDGRGDKLPAQLPASPDYQWTFEVEVESLSGIAATTEYVVLAGRDLLDTKDVITCLSTSDGSLVWQHDYSALPPIGAEVRDGKLDYGNSPRATPLIVGNLVVTQGAMGDLVCLSLETGEVKWSKNYVLDFDAPIPIWGWSGSPLHHQGLIIVQPGAAESALVALSLTDGEVQWETNGGRTAYTSPIIMNVGGKDQVITTDANFWGGYDAKTGKQIWRLKPDKAGEFNVPTALALGEQLMIIGEINGARLHSFDKSGQIITKPQSKLINFNPDTHTPVRVGNWIVGAHTALWIMSVQDLSQHQEIDEVSITGHCSIVTDGTKFLILSESGELTLFEFVDSQPKVLGNLALVDRRSKIYAHPAWVDGSLIFREGNRVHCVRLN